MDKFDCYELCVQSPRHVAGFLRGVYRGGDESRGEPLVLREDFCGTAAISRRWIADGKRKGMKCSAVGVDFDAEVLKRALVEAGREGVSERLRLACGDVLEEHQEWMQREEGIKAGGIEGSRPEAEGADVIFVGNFSIGYIHERARLVEYLRVSRARLERGAAGWGGGVFVCDVYDGPGKLAMGSLKRVHPGRGKEIVHYEWEHREADALTAMVTNAIHFRVVIDGEVVAEFPDAFIYRWRLWSIAEVREAMMEAGFVLTEVYKDVSERPEPLTHGKELGESGIVCVVGRV